MDIQEPEQKASKQRPAFSIQPSAKALAAFAFARVGTRALASLPEQSRRVHAERCSAVFPAVRQFSCDQQAQNVIHWDCSRA